jgi:pyruvate-ferredoxin/flavodoxin oxidoreductase
MADGTNQQKLAVESGTWPLYRFDPRRVARGEAPLQLDSPPPKVPIETYMLNENRFRMLQRLGEDRWRRLVDAAQADVDRRSALYQKLALLSPAASSSAVEQKKEPQTSEVTS